MTNKDIEDGVYQLNRIEMYIWRQLEDKQLEAQIRAILWEAARSLRSEITYQTTMCGRLRTA
jgi:hypothetical protein